MSHPSEKYDFVSWDDDIPNIMESHTIPWFQITNQNTLITIKKRYSLILYHWMNPTLDDPILNGNPTQNWKHSAGMAFEKCFFGPMGQSEQNTSTGGLIAVIATWHLP